MDPDPRDKKSPKIRQKSAENWKKKKFQKIRKLLLKFKNYFIKLITVKTKNY